MSTSALLEGFKCPGCGYRRTKDDTDVAETICPSCKSRYPKHLPRSASTGTARGGRPFRLAAIFAAVAIVGFGGWEYMKKLERDNYSQDMKRVASFSEDWADRAKLAGSTPRIQLSSRVAELQEQRRKWGGIMLKSKCLIDAKPLYDASMKATIEGLMRFMAQEEVASAIAIDNARSSQREFEQAIAACAPA